MKSYPKYTPEITAETQILNCTYRIWSSDKFFKSWKLWRYFKQTDQKLSDNNEWSGNGIAGTTDGDKSKRGS